jgi:hypothetical protein
VAIAVYRFQVTIHALPVDLAQTKTYCVGKATYTALGILPEVAAGTRFDCTFEEALGRLETLERNFCEPDGSFVWVSAQAADAWQVDGNLYDRDGKLIFVDLKGTCPQEEFDRLLACLGWPETPLMFQLVREAVWLAEPEFRRWAQASAAEPT